MYAVIEDGSRQYRVQRGDVVMLDYREAEKDSTLELTDVLLYVNEGDVQIGRPKLDGARVLGKVLGEASKKYYIQYLRRRKNSRRLKGHRQWHLKVLIEHILLPGEEPPEEPEEQPTSEAPATPTTTEAPENESPAEETAEAQEPQSESSASEEEKSE